MAEPKLLRIPHHFHSVEQVLQVAAKMDCRHILVLCVGSDGGIDILDNELTLADANWYLDQAKGRINGWI